jgi:hypothetical protein
MKRFGQARGVVLALCGVMTTAGAERPAPGMKIPAELQPPEGQVVLLRVKAEGTQIYVGKARADDASRFEWQLKGPNAELFDDRGQKVGKHYAGPTWEAADGSKVRAAVKKMLKSPDAGAIPWLLLEAKDHEGEGRLSKVKYILRVDTRGGRPPAQCTRDDAGKETSVKYQATYLFYGDKP